ncbi:hypothetical protein MSAN_01627700 [Mycena sanguinolenta]|uniref:DUF6532 domain-containing protein n=1 Tax=Mycena sanguinolenta TaxID=230812 RepID=A0A8H6Y1V0_9AGAR|nr:hypothetical protein MSAN_01627700 [Mycena sanguinolenta]
MQDSDDELSATSDEENLTRAEKARRTRALNLAQEEAANKKLTEETVGGRRANNKALQDKVWETSRNMNNSRKRAVSSSAEPVKTTKKTKANHDEEPDDMEIDEETPRSQAVVKNSSKTTRTKGSQGQDPQKAKGIGKEIQASTRRYHLTIDTESDDDSAAPQADVSSKPSGTNAATGKSVKATPIRNKPTPKSNFHYFSGGKALGFKYIGKLGSNRADRPEELVLPDAMICLAGANIWAALRAWETGRYGYVEAKEFSQERLENTYTSLQAVLETQRNGLLAKNFNKTMHKLYKKVTQSNSSEAALGSANSVI